MTIKIETAIIWEILNEYQTFKIFFQIRKRIDLEILFQTKNNIENKLNTL